MVAGYCDGSSIAQCEAQAQAEDGAILVFDLAAEFGGLRHDSGGIVLDEDGGLDFVAVLSAGASRSISADRTFFEKFDGVHGCGV